MNVAPLAQAQPAPNGHRRMFWSTRNLSNAHQMQHYCNATRGTFILQVSGQGVLLPDMNLADWTSDGGRKLITVITMVSWLHISDICQV